jgi:hypothetical protein
MTRKYQILFQEMAVKDGLKVIKKKGIKYKKGSNAAPLFIIIVPELILVTYEPAPVCPER